MRRVQLERDKSILQAINRVRCDSAPQSRSRTAAPGFGVAWVGVGVGGAGRDVVRSLPP
jgi:hypothetical protein